MKVIFLDLDGTLNSEASFRYEARQKKQNIQDTLSAVACSNLQYILEQDSSVKIVISSTWRRLHTMMELQNILNAYGVEAARVIGVTPSVLSGHRGHEIRLWLDKNPNVTKYVILDDDDYAATCLNMENGIKDSRGYFFQTAWEDGLLFKQAKDIAKIFRGD